MSQLTTDSSSSRKSSGYLLPVILITGFLLRLLHLTTMAQNPRTFHLGADEGYYIRFAESVAGGGWGLTYEFLFMDPLYGYVSGLSHHQGVRQPACWQRPVTA